MQTLLIIISWIVAAITGGMAIVFYRKLKNQEYQNELVIRHHKAQQKALEDLQQQASIDENNRYKFIACASHDLRQPLHALALFSNVLGNKHLEPDVKELTDKIKRSVNALVELFNTLFDVSKLETGSTTVEQRDVSLQSILQLLDAEYKPQVEAKGLLWCCESNNFFVHTDPSLLETILRNLISNALRYTKQGNINLSSHRHNGQIYISVSDSGVGIAPQQQQEIFQEFHQLSNTGSGGTTGLGLGLSIVERLIKILGHEIQVQSEVGRGTTFTLLVDEGNSSTVQIESAELKSVNDLAGLHILVIDDDPQVREGMQSILESWQCEVSLAGSKAEVVKLITDIKIKPQAIVSDYRLSKHLSAPQLLEEVFASSGMQIPTVIISGDTSKSVINTIKEKGYLYLPKPVSPAKLRAFVRNVAKKI